MTQQMAMLEGYLPEFSGLLSKVWAPPLYGPVQRAADDYASSQQSERKLDRVDYLAAFAEAGDFPRQCSTLARSYCDIFAIHLAISGRCSFRASSGGAVIQVSTSSGVVRITGIALG